MKDLGSLALLPPAGKEKIHQVETQQPHTGSFSTSAQPVVTLSFPPSNRLPLPIRTKRTRGHARSLAHTCSAWVWLCHARTLDLLLPLPPMWGTRQSGVGASWWWTRGRSIKPDIDHYLGWSRRFSHQSVILQFIAINQRRENIANQDMLQSPKCLAFIAIADGRRTKERHSVVVSTRNGNSTAAYVKEKAHVCSATAAVELVIMSKGENCFRLGIDAELGRDRGWKGRYS